LCLIVRAMSGTYALYGENEYGDRVHVNVEVCWRCGMPVVTSIVSMSEHVDRMHPVAAEPEVRPRHALDE
jgi:hypothetical protein